MTTSKKTLSAGKPLGVRIHIKNVSARRVMLDKLNTELVPPDVLPGETTTGRCLYFPADSDRPFYVLEPDDETYVSCTTGGWLPSNPLRLIGSEFYRFWSFSPGDFEFAVVLHYETGPTRAEHHIRTFGITVPVEAPQSVILLGAGIGGLCAYVLILRSRSPVTLTVMPGSFAKRAFNEIFRAFSAILFSAIVTIVLARISESQFLVRVSVEDVWGAVAIGFVSSYLGKKVFDDLLGHSRHEAD